MKKIFFLILIVPILCAAQQKEDRRIFITMADTSNIYQTVKNVLIAKDYIIKENGNKDTISTYSKDINSINGNMIVEAIIDENRVILKGFYVLKQQNILDYSVVPKNYIPIHYYSGSKTWKILRGIAEKIGMDITYGK